MKFKTIIFFCLTCAALNMLAQEYQDMVNKYRAQLMDGKNLKPVQSIKMIVDIKTPEGPMPATIWLLDNMSYKLEMKGKKGKSIEYVGQEGYKALSEDAKIKNMEPVGSELHMRKKILLHFYPFLHLIDGQPMKFIPFGEHFSGAMPQPAMAGMNPESAPVEEAPDPSLLRYAQILPMNEMHHIFYLDIRDMQIAKIETKYMQDGVEKTEVYSYKNYMRTPEGHSYPSTFTTIFGEAKVKSIQFNPKLSFQEFETNF